MTFSIRNTFASTDYSQFEFSNDQSEKLQSNQTNSQFKPKLPKIESSVGFTALGCDTEEKLQRAAYMAAASRAGIADAAAQRQFADQMQRQNGVNLVANGSMKLDDASVKARELNRDVTFVMDLKQIAALREFRQDYIENGGAIRFNKKPKIDLRQANTADGVTTTQITPPETRFHVFLKNDGRPVTAERILAQYSEDTYKGSNLWGDNFRKIGEMSVGQGVKPKIIKITPAGNNKIIDIELSPRDRAVINENYKIVQQQVNEIEKIAAEIDRNNPVSQFILGALDGIKDNLVGTATMIAHPLETLQTIKEAIAALSQLSADDVAKIGTLLKDKITATFTTKDGINSIPYGAGYVVGTVATDVVIGKGAGLALEGLKEIKPLAALLGKLSELKVLTKTKTAEMFSDEAAKIAKQKFWQRAKELGSNPNNITNIVADPELWARATQVGGNLVGKGYTKFADFSMQVKKVLGDIGEATMSKLYRESLVSLDLSKGKQIFSAGGKVVDEAVIREAKEKVFDLVKNNKPVELEEFFESKNGIRNRYGNELVDELKKSRDSFVDALHETERRTVNIHDLLGGHIREEHIGRSESWLRNRLNQAENSDLNFASSFKNDEIANRTIGKFVKRFNSNIETFLKNPKSLKLEAVFETGEQSLGVGVTRGNGKAWDSTKAYVMIVKDNSDQSWHILTSYPTLAKEGIR